MHFVTAPVLLRSLRLLPTTSTCSPLLLARAINTTTGDAAGAGDPAVHSGDPPEDAYPERAPKFSGAEHKLTNNDKKKKKDKEAVAQTTPPPLKGETVETPPPFAPPPKLESREVPPPGAPSLHQTRRRRRGSYHSAAPITTAEASSVGAHGGGKEEEDAAVAELREYYKSHKPSPLSGVEVADTRKPITQATSDGPGDEGRGAVAEEETVDAALARAERMFKAAAERGNAAWPHSRALARMLSRRGVAAAATATAIFA